ncbi:MAG: hypothetical protein V1913_07695 [Fibrobacterota bacterium]
MTSIFARAPLTFCIAGLPVRFMLPVPFLQPLKQAFAPFISRNKKPCAHIEVRLMLKRGGPGKRPRLVSRGNSLQAERGDMSFRFNFKRMTGRLSIVRDRFVFNAFLRIFYATLLPYHEGFLLHASAIADKNKGWAFAGPSGAGKTTLAKLLSGHAVLTDELAAMRREKGTFYLYGTPFQGEYSGPRRALRTRLAALFFLKKMDRTVAYPLPPGIALKKLLQCILFFSPDTASVSRLLRTAERLIDSGNVKELAFSKERTEFLEAFRKTCTDRPALYMARTL